MDNQPNPPLSWSYYYQGKSMEELRHSLLYTTLELETTRLTAQEEIRRREDQVTHLSDLLTRTLRERDEVQEKCQQLMVEKLLLQQHQQTTPLSGISGIEDEPRRGDSNTGFSSSDCEESIMSSPVTDPIPPPPPPPAPLAPPPQHTTVQLAAEKPLPEKGKLLQAVMKAGPLLQTLLLAGPLPQWRHPPPPLDSFEIPPVAIPTLPSHLLHPDSPTSINGCNNNSCSNMNKKRGLVVSAGSDFSTNTKYQRALQPVLH